jgi:hypothetical protein
MSTLKLPPAKKGHLSGEVSIFSYIGQIFWQQCISRNHRPYEVSLATEAYTYIN